MPDIPNFSWAEYGMRCGMPRILDMFADRNLPGIWRVDDGKKSIYFQGSKKFRTPLCGASGMTLS